MTVDTRAGHPADPAALVDVERCSPRTTTSCPTRRSPGSGSRSGRPATAAPRCGRVQRGAHPRHDRGDLRATARTRGIDGPLFIGRDTHALSEPAYADRARGARGARRRRPGRRRATATRRRRRVSHAILVAQPRPAATRPGRRHRRHAVAQPARGRRLQVQPAERRPGRHRRHRLDPGRGEPAARGRASTASSGVAVSSDARAAAAPLRLRRRATSTTSRSVIDMDAIRASGLRIGVDPLGGASVAYWPAIARALRPRPDRHERRRRPAVRVHDRRLGRPDPDGPVVALRDGPAGRAARPVRRRVRQRRRRRPPRDRHARRRADEPEPLPVGGGRATCSAAARDWGADVAVGKTLVSSAMIDRVAADLGRRLLEVPVGFKWFVDGLVDGIARVRRRGERRRLVPAPRRDGLDDRQGRDHRVPARRRADGARPAATRRGSTPS